MTAALIAASNRVIDGKYALGRELGRGAAGAVYESEHLLVGRRVAIKVLDPELGGDRAVRTRFVAEARAAAKIGHPNVVDIFDLGVARDGSCYMVMELLEGETLERVIESRGALSPAYACELMLQVLGGLAAAHARGIVHRDLKPANVIVTHPRPDRPRVKVLDFGIAKGLVEAAFETSCSVVGTPHYMAPEQAVGGDVDARADIYSACAMLFEMLAGAPPCDGESIEEILSKVLVGAHEPLNRLRPDIPAELAAIIEAGLSLDPDHRPQSADELAALFSPFVARAHLPSITPATLLSGEPIPLLAVRVANRNGGDVNLIYPKIPRAPASPHFGKSVIPLPRIERGPKPNAAERRSHTLPARRKRQRRVRQIAYTVLALAAGCAAGVAFVMTAGGL